MPRPAITERYVDMDQRANKQRVMAAVGRLAGLYEVSIKPRRASRSKAQNRYMWGCVIESVRAGINEAWGEDLTAEETHLLLKERFLTYPVVNRKTGEVVNTITRSTASLDVMEFSSYIDKIVKFAAEFLNTDIPTADQYEPQAKPMKPQPGDPSDF